MTHNVSQTAAGVENFTKGITESARFTHSITDNIAQVDKIAQQTSSGADQSQKSSQELAKMAEKLQTLMGQFKTKETVYADN